MAGCQEGVFFKFGLPHFLQKTKPKPQQKAATRVLNTTSKYFRSILAILLFLS